MSFAVVRRCRARWFLSFPIFLILIQTFVVFISAGVFPRQRIIYDLVSSLTDGIVYYNTEKYGPIWSFGVILVWSLAGFVSAWVTGWKFKLIDMVTVGLVTTSVGVLLKSILSLVSATDSSQSAIVIEIFDYLGTLIMIVGMSFVANNALQLAIEQIPEASADQLSSLVSWYVLSTSLGWWLQEGFRNIFILCFASNYNMKMNHDPILTLIVFSLCALVLALHFVFKHKFLDSSLMSSAIHIVYAVLKYAFKHKFPRKRSALTYWQDAPVPRLNLGKTEYGGPFKSEQVEDVKTFIRISVMFVGVTFYLSCLYSHSFSLYYIDHWSYNRSLSIGGYTNSCTNAVIYYFRSHYSWWMIVFVVLYEFVFIPVLSYRMPNMLRRLGLASICIFPLVLSSSTIVSIDSLSLLTGSVNLMWYQTGLAVVGGFLRALFYITSLELICAQAPYSMRNYFISVAQTVGWCCPMLSPILFIVWKDICSKKYCSLSYSLFYLVLCAIGLVILLVLIKHYRRRSRGQEDKQNQQMWVEEVYGKYVAENTSVVCSPLL